MGAKRRRASGGCFMGIDPVAVDPEKLHSFDRYAYGNNNSYKYTDPDGRMAQMLLRASWGLGWEDYHGPHAKKSQSADEIYRRRR